MKRTLVLLVMLPWAVCSAQVHSISTTAEYVLGLSTRLGVENASGIGAGAEIRFSITEQLLLGIAGGYASFSIDQVDQLNGWNWKFWNDRYYPKIQSDMRADPNLSSVIGSVQSMDLIPVALMLEYHFQPVDDLLVVPGLGGGVAFFTRKLYANETWTKRYPQSDYTLTYNLRNFAPEKRGQSYFLALGCEARYGIGAGVSACAGVQYRQYLTAVSGTGEFPFTSALGVNVGVIFHY